MKKLTALLLALMLLCGLVPAMADDEVITYPIEDSKGNTIGWEDYKDGKLQEKHYGKDGSWYDEYYDNGKLDERYVKIGDYEDNDVTWQHYDKHGNLVDFQTWMRDPDKGTNNYVTYNEKGQVTSMFYSDENGSVAFTEGGGTLYGSVNGLTYNTDDHKWYDADGNESEAPDLMEYYGNAKKGIKDKRAARVKETIWYGSTNLGNTACVIGISLRDQFPGLTDKWYHVLPVDLSVDGVQTFDLVASAKYFLGKVRVTVSGDDVITEYAYMSSPTGYEIYPKEECLAWFTGVEEITSDYLSNPTPTAQFGTAISKSKDLNGQNSALLFICNRVTYRVPLNSRGATPREYWQNSTTLADYFAGKQKLFKQVEEEYAAKKAEETPAK